MVSAPTELCVPLGEEANTQETGSNIRGGRKCDERPE